MFTCHFIIGVTVWLFSCSLIVASLLKLIYVVNLLFWSLWLAFSPANRFENLCKRIKKEGKEKRENVISFFLLSTTTEPIVYFLLQSKTWILQPTLRHSQFAERNNSEFTSFRLIQPIGTWPSFWTYHFFLLIMGDMPRQFLSSLQVFLLDEKEQTFTASIRIRNL